LAISDIFTAMTVDRPYRKGMSPKEANSILQEMGETGLIDTDILRLLLKNSDEIDELRRKSQIEAADDYENIR
jgi:HD-GYP domain-containing protein (c-di-GMP phosphodiesterase class II)